MSRAPINPFRPTRWEHQREGQQLIWYSDFADTLAAEKSFYVNGSRGSGKTTLLRSICWEDLTKNTSLKMQRTLADAASIGCYIRFPDHLTSALGATEWSRVYPNAPDPELEFHRYFSLLVELTCSERAMTASHELRVGGFATINASREIAFVESIFDEFSKLRALSEREGVVPRTLPEMCRLFRAITREMNQAAARGAVLEISETLPAREPGELLGVVTKKLAEMVSLKRNNGLRSPGFKFCLDDCEVLNASQQISINTLVRICKAPVSWVVSYVGSQFEDSKTYIEQQMLSDADRRLESLDQRSSATFRELCQAVASLRLLFEVSDQFRSKRPARDIKQFFSLDRRLGFRSVNDMMSIMVRRSVNPIAKSLKESSELLRSYLSTNFSRGESNARTLPYYQAYTLLHWQPTVGKFKSSFSKHDERELLHRATLLTGPSDEAWLRRKQRAALFHFASNIGTNNIPLSGQDIVVSLADGSIRDFLEILGYIYEAYARHHRLDITEASCVERFVSSGSQIAADIQTTGIVAASNAYFAGVGARAEKDFDVVLRMIDGLGSYTSLLQSDHSDPSVFGRAERGIFTVRFEAKTAQSLDEASAREKVVWNTIRQAELSGYLRTIDAASRDVLKSEEPSGGELVVRLHRRFSPHFRYSYRGPYEVSTIRASDLWQLCDRTNPIKPHSWAQSMARTDTIDEQIELPLSWKSIDD